MHITTFDIETNAINDWLELSDLEEIHCLVLRTGNEVKVYNSQRADIADGLVELGKADIIVGHNVVKFDLPAIKKLYPAWTHDCCVRDTMLMARLVYPDTRNDDFKRTDEFPRNLIGSHSLKAWGLRMGEAKGDFGSDTDWSKWSQDMEDYCVQDTLVTQRLYQQLDREQPNALALMLEHSFAEIIYQQERNGFGFDTQGAKNLHADLLDRKAEVERELQKIFPAAEHPMKTPAYWFVGQKKYKTKTEAKLHGHKDIDIERGPNRVKRIPFNPGSRDQIAQQLMKKYGWKPKQFTGEGKPQIDESILTAMDYDEAAVLVEYLTVAKRLGQLAEGKEAWLKTASDDRLHGSVNTNGTVTGRCTHARPNVAQVPAVSSPYGKECRSLFTAHRGDVLVGCDASGLELRMLAHYLAFTDGGAYAKEVVDGDIHTANQKAAGLPNRNDAKTFIYAYLYGAGDQKLGSIVNGGIREGKKLRARFLSKMPALKKLQKAVAHNVETKGFLLGLDGRKLPVRSKHSALNLLLQSAGAVVMKEATVILHKSLYASDLKVKQVAHIHDEVQLSCNEGVADEVGRIACESIRRAGVELSLRCPLDAEYRVGKNWAETH